MLSTISSLRFAARRVPAAAPAALRSYSDGSFNKKEKAHEDQYSRTKEQEQLKKLREEIERKRAELADLEKQHSEVESTTSKA